MKFCAFTMSDESQKIESYVAAAPSEPDISLPGSHLYRARVSYDSKVNVQMLLRVAFQDQLRGMGRVEIEEICVRYSTIKSGLTISCGIVNATATLKVAAIGMRRGNFKVTSNAMNAGDLFEKDVQIPGNLSRQIQPISSLLPDFKFCLEIDDGVTANVEFVFRVFGEVIRDFEAGDLKT